MSHKIYLSCPQAEVPSVQERQTELAGQGQKFYRNGLCICALRDVKFCRRSSAGRPRLDFRTQFQKRREPIDKTPVSTLRLSANLAQPSRHVERGDGHTTSTPY